MKRFVEGLSRSRTTGLPENRLDDFISANNPVRIIDAFVDSLDLRELGFKGVDPSPFGRPAYHPAVMLKLYLYGYFYHIQSCRCLEREAQRNVEVMWLLQRRTPDFKTIANFRQHNGEAIDRVCRQFIKLCRELKLFSNSTVAIDGSKFKGVNNRDQNFTPAKIELWKKRATTKLTRYQAQLESVAKHELILSEAKIAWVNERINALGCELDWLQAVEDYLQKAPDNQLSLTDPDARSMKLRGQGIVGYNVQLAVEADNHFIVHYDVINTGCDRHQLRAMAKAAKAVLEANTLTVVTDAGYYANDEIVACEQDNISVYIPKPPTSTGRPLQLFPREAFLYLPDEDEYVCPAGEHMNYRFDTNQHGKIQRVYATSGCLNCDIKARCTTSKWRRIRRNEHEEVLERVRQRLENEPDKMHLRRETVEHPFGTLKHQMGYTHFQTKRLTGVKTETSLHVMAYNLKRAINVMGAERLLQVVYALALFTSLITSSLEQLLIPMNHLCHLLKVWATTSAGYDLEQIA